MELDIDFILYMKVIATLMAIVVVVGVIVVPASFRKHNRERELKMAGPTVIDATMTSATMTGAATPAEPLPGVKPASRKPVSAPRRPYWDAGTPDGFGHR
jgi:hypothetical protein